MNKILKFLMLPFLMVLPMIAFGQDAPAEPVGLEDVVNSIIELVKNYKGMSGIVLAGSVISIMIQLLKTSLLSSFFKSESSKLLKRLIVLVLGTLMSMVAMVAAGSGWLDAVLTGLISSGAAVSIYEAFKAFRDVK